MQVYPGALVDGRLIAAYQHLAKATAADPQPAVAAVAARCQQLLAAMTPLPDDLKALAADPWTEQDDRWYYVALAQHYGLVRMTGCCLSISVCFLWWIQGHVPSVHMVKCLGHRSIT